MKDRKLKTRSARTTDSEWDSLKAIAEKQGYSTTAGYLRDLIIADIQKNQHLIQQEGK